MKFQYKKYLYLINDVSNVLLNKEREKLSETAHKLRIALIIVGALLVVSILFNIYFLIK